MNHAGHHIDGAIRHQADRTAEVTDPATGRVIRRVALAGAADVGQAVRSARAAFPGWRDQPPAKRARILFRYKELLENNAGQIARTVTEEHGKVLDDALGEVGRGIEIVEYACGAPELLKGEHARNVGPAIDSWSEFQPLGVVAGITPFNFPAMVPLWMFPIAIACGNTFVLKPSEKDPSAALRLAALFTEAGLPDGVLNVVNGNHEAVDALLTCPDIDAVSFVGSTPVAEHVYRTGTAHGKRVQALGGAKNHAIVLPDADTGIATTALMGAAYGSCGERCMAISVAVCVGEDTAERLVAMLTDRIADLKLGPGRDPGNDMGPLITAAHLHKVRAYLNIGVQEGAVLVVDGRGFNGPAAGDGFFLGASLFDHVTPDMRIYREEIFGPVLCVVRADSLHAAVELINAHEYGNGACIFTRDGEAARYFTDTVKVGMAGVNVPLPVPAAVHSFGGWKRSLFGDLYAYGPDAVRFYTRRKTITQRWPARDARETSQFAFPSGA